MNARTSPLTEVTPTSVRIFEALSILSVLLPILLFQDGGPFGELAELLIAVALTLWITRGRSRLGRLVYTSLWLFVAVVVVFALVRGDVPQDAPRYPLLILGVEMTVLLTLLWSPSTSCWLASGSAKA